MKYENFAEAKRIVEQIQKLKSTFDELDLNPDVLIVHKNTTMRIYTIGTFSGCEHAYYDLAKEITDKIKVDLHKRISKLHEELELL